MKTLLSAGLFLFSFILLAVDTSVEISPRMHVNTDVGACIELEGRAADYVEAFQTLQCENPGANIYAIVEGISIDHIQDMQTMSNDLLIRIVWGRHAPFRNKVVKVEKIKELGVRTRNPSPASVYFPSSTDAVRHHHDDIHHVDDTSHPHHP